MGGGRRMNLLTGETAYRQGWRGKIILMVEYHNPYDPCDDCPESIQIQLRWRDASVKDLVGLAKLGVFGSTK
jgi:hypothetical protein